MRDGLCSSCGEKFVRAGDELESCLAEQVELEGGVCHPIEEFEEMRLLLNSFLKPAMLDQLLFLSKELNKEPKESEAYSWFARNSSVGRDCRYAVGALKRFKERRLDGMEAALKSCLVQIEKLRE